MTTLIPTADLFCGLGGASEGARQTGRFDIQFAANHWDAAVDFHERNHPGCETEQQDIQQMDMRMLPDLGDGLLIAAPECPGFSQNSQPARAGTGGSHRPDIEKARARMILQRSTTLAVVAAAEIARPKVIVVENVADIFRWELWKPWCGMLEALGYTLRPHVLNTATFGSPQDRQRMILTASQGQPIELQDGDLVPGTIESCLEADDHPDNRWSTIASKSERMQWRIRKAQREAGSKCFWNNVSESRGRRLDECFPTATTQSGTQFCIVDGDRIRVMNPREMARVQSFPDHYLIPKQRKLASKMIGNAIDVRMFRGVASQVSEQMN